MKRLKLFVAFILLISLSGCKQKEKIPQSVLPQEKMQLVLKDMMKADQFLSDYVLNRDTTKKRELESIKIYDQIFSLHNITAEKFYKSFTYYKQHPLYMQAIMDSLSKPVEAKDLEIVPVDVLDSTTVDPVQDFRPLTDTTRKQRMKIIQSN